MQSGLRRTRAHSARAHACAHTHTPRRVQSHSNTRAHTHMHVPVHIHACRHARGHAPRTRMCLAPRARPCTHAPMQALPRPLGPHARPCSVLPGPPASCAQMPRETAAGLLWAAGGPCGVGAAGLCVDRALGRGASALARRVGNATRPSQREDVAGTGPPGAWPQQRLKFKGTRPDFRPRWHESTVEAVPSACALWGPAG